MKIACASYGEELSKLFSNQSRDVMNDKSFQEAFPEFELVKEPEQFLATSQGGFRFATTTGGAITGFGADVIIVDDPIKIQDANSEVAREHVREWMSTLPTRLNNQKKGAIVLVMHRVHEDDIVARLLEQGGWTVLNLPAQAQQNEHTPYGPDLIHVRKAGEFLHPECFGPVEAARSRKELGNRWYEALYNQNPLPPESDFFDVSMFKRYDKAPVCDYIFFSVDVATIANAGDYSVCTIWGHAGGGFYLLDVWRKQVTLPQLEKALLELDGKWNPHLVVVEAVGSGVSLYQYLHDKLGRYVHGRTPRGSKQHRFEAATLAITNGQIFLPNSAPWLAAYLKELLAFPNGKHDDQVDSTSQFLYEATWLLRLAKQGQNPRSAKPFGAEDWGSSVRLYSIGRRRLIRFS
jgi:predicted phage terminase large subunit-like protein